MYFHNYTIVRSAGFRGSSSDLISSLFLSELDDTDVDWMLQGMLELRWMLSGRPFYNVYPIAIEMCAKLALNMTWKDIYLPESHLLLRFPSGHEPFQLKSAIVKSPSHKSGSEPFPHHSSRSKWVDRMSSFELVASMKSTCESLDHVWCYEPGFGKTLSEENVLDSMRQDEQVAEHDCRFMLMNWASDPGSVSISRDQTRFLTRLVAFIGLLANGKDLITPAILASDREEYDATSDQARKRWLEERAIRRQGRGFDVGRDLEREKNSSPHWRCPHLALFHTGPGRTVPVLKLRSGSVVIPKCFSEVPTGYMGRDGEKPDSGQDARPVFRPHISKRLRFKVLRRDGYRCQLCGLQQSDGVRLEVDHKVPVAKGGATSPDNLWTLCHPCNNGKSDSDLFSDNACLTGSGK